VEAQVPSSQTSDRFDAGLAQTLRNAQIRYGIQATGMLDDATRRALNVPVETRLIQIRANLQRWRWAPRHLSSERIDVNVPSGVAAYYINNRPALTMRVAVGRPGDETPTLTSTIRSIVIDPPWNVPDSIAERELLPKEQAEPGYLASHGFVQVSDTGGTRLQQAPGPTSALGVVKFNFENRYGVYLHDTPSRAAFAQARRSVSHGCMRLERAVDLATMLLARQGWSSDRLSQAIAAGQTSEVPLQTPVPVRIFYWTAWVSNGQVSFRDDIYGWDEATARLADGVVQRPAQVVAENTAPTTHVSADQSMENPELIPAQTFNDYAAGDEEAQGEKTPDQDDQSDATPQTKPAPVQPLPPNQSGRPKSNRASTNNRE
jgi:murein L,D-transpeptidase YcbB/YkuD